MIVRVSKADRSRFVILDISASRDPRLSFKAVGLHTYLMTMADGWQVRVAQLASRSDFDGRESVQRAFRELKEAGYAELRTGIDGEGKITGREWIIFEISQNDDPAHQTALPFDGESRPTGKPSDIKKDQSEKKDQDPKEEQIPLFGLVAEVVTEKPDPVESIYQLYPRKIDRKHALKAIKAALGKVDVDTLAKSVEAFAATVKAAGTKPEFIPYPATWFNGERWNDNTNEQQHEKPQWLKF